MGARGPAREYDLKIDVVHQLRIATPRSANYGAARSVNEIVTGSEHSSCPVTPIAASHK